MIVLFGMTAVFAASSYLGFYKGVKAAQYVAVGLLCLLACCDTVAL